MAEAKQGNYHFKRLVNGAPSEVLAQLGEALVAVDSQRAGKSDDAPSLLRAACLSLTKYLASIAGPELNAEQFCFLMSGALADSVEVRNPRGGKLKVSLLPEKVYAALLKQVESGIDAAEPYLLSPLKRLAALGNEELLPLDLDRPGRYRGPGEGKAIARVSSNIDALTQEVADSAERLGTINNELQQAIREFVDAFRTEKLSEVLKQVGQVSQLVQQALDCSHHAKALTNLPLEPGSDLNPAGSVLSKFEGELQRRIVALSSAQQEAMLELRTLVQHGQALLDAEHHQATGEQASNSVRSFVVSSEARKDYERDLISVNSMMVQSLVNHPQRTSWSASRILLVEHTEKFKDPLAECYATADNLRRSIAKVDKLHPDCFPHDAQGNPIIPPVIIEPGVNLVKWMDDRFLLGFVCAEQPRPGASLSLNPVDIAVMQLYGQFLARGDIFNYRGERTSDNFMGDYAGEVEQKAVVKFTGSDKKMTLRTSQAEKDAAGREDAVRDYVDFIHHVYNGLPLPKKISPRKAGVFLTYCLIGDEEFTAMLALRLTAAYDNMVTRAILLKLAHRKQERVIELIERSMEKDPQIKGRYRQDIGTAVKDVMGVEYLRDAQQAGLISGAAAAEPSGEGTEKPAESHDYFEL